MCVLLVIIGVAGRNVNFGTILDCWAGGEKGVPRLSGFVINNTLSWKCHGETCDCVTEDGLRCLEVGPEEVLLFFVSGTFITSQ